MQKKYELLKDDTKEYFGITLYRIKALISFGVVVAGELGGYIEAEKNLDQSGDAWVSGNAWVCGDARVCGDAWVCGNAWVSGNARVYGNARVSGNAEVYGNAEVRSCAIISERKMIFWASNVGPENGTLTVFNGKDGLIVTRGCFTGTVDEFLAKSAEVHDEKTKREYELLIEVAKSRILG
ncbi:hypothetical protein [Rodentibacter genomosp. 2]|uniref:Polymer-forming cytoskeletal protein n=1 Tax=Rodentibacter genomosp. 2 TaxID=1908266 RepID=A0A1V3JNN2_9PAST|nr:hypothetical protein [Rodentibacter genomosp. 2]OOF58294.1 hypothetical protein BKK55_02680 [Rodentibacter genomosp. 2]